jgi:predicted DNA-binding transcriptional regulator YafY
MSVANLYQSSSISRLRRLIAELTLLQSKRIVTAQQLAQRFDVSVRTIYRDIRLLEQAGVPVVTEEGKGFSLMDGYRLSPFLFTEPEAGAILAAEKLIASNSDSSFVNTFSDAAAKMKAALRSTERDKMDLLSTRIKVYPSKVYPSKETTRTNRDWPALQKALTSYSLIQLRYRSLHTEQLTERTVEPFAFFYASNGWLLLAFCRLREQYRFFRLDRMESFRVLDQTFQPHPITLSQYLEQLAKNEQAGKNEQLAKDENHP